MVNVSTSSLSSFGRFLTSGALNTFATYLLYLFLLQWFSYRVSYTAAYVTGIGLAYVMNRYLVFRRPGGRAGPLYVAVIYSGQFLLGLLLITAWVSWIRGPTEIAPLFAIAVTLPLTYFLNSKVFSEAGRSAHSRFSLGRDVTQLSTWRRTTLAILVGLPLVSLALNAIAWVQFGFDLPFFDDWRGYDSGEVDSLELSYLFRPINDTLTPIGFAMDALAQRLLAGNSVLYQLLSMIAVLGSLLLLQWKLLMTALGDRHRAAVCFVFTLLMLQPGSYWGRENMAYQQALPLVFTLTALWLAVRGPLRESWNLLLIFLMGLLSGFSYISGAFGALAAGAGMVFAVCMSRGDIRRPMLLRAGSMLALAGVVTSAAQVVYAILPSKGGTHIAGKSLALPFELDFWFFYLGKLARSLLLPASLPALSLALVLLACVLFLVVSYFLMRTVRKISNEQSPDLVTAALFGAIAALVITYLGLVSAGRANFRPVEIQSPGDVFLYAFERFHFFWATLLWPWVVAAVLVLYDGSGAKVRAKGLGRAIGAGALVAAILLMIRMDAFGHVDRHSNEADFRRQTVECLMSQLQKGEGIRCEEFNLPDLTPAYIYARTIGASFVRYFPILPLELGTAVPSPWFRLTRDGARVESRDLARLSGSTYRAGEDPQLLIDVSPAEGMASCVMLDVRAELRSSRPDVAMLYFRPLGQRHFSEVSSRVVSVSGDPNARIISFRLENPLGFESTLRLDPVRTAQDFELTEIEVRCRLRSRYDTQAPFFAITDGTSPGKLERLVAVGDLPGHFRSGIDPRVLFQTRHRQSMASCRFLQVQAIYNVQSKDIGQLFYRPLGAHEFSEANSLSLTVLPKAEPETVSFVVESASGFEDELRFDPGMVPQDLQFADIKVRCLKRIDQDKLTR